MASEGQSDAQIGHLFSSYARNVLMEGEGMNIHDVFTYMSVFLRRLVG